MNLILCMTTFFLKKMRRQCFRMIEKDEDDESCRLLTGFVIEIFMVESSRLTRHDRRDGDWCLTLRLIVDILSQCRDDSIGDTNASLNRYNFAFVQ